MGKRGVRVSIVAIWLVMLTSLLAFQNCAENPLKKVVVDSYAAPVAKLTSQLCNDARPVPTKGSKFVFIVDMSASNFGEWYSRPVGSYSVWYWDKNKSTDSNMARIDAVDFFLNNCGNQEGAQFAVIGFSKTAGTISVENGKSVLSCTNPVFGDIDTARENLEKLRDVQRKDRLWYEQWDESKNKYLSEAEPDTLVMGPTSYVSALECADDLIVDDLTKNLSNQSDSYHLFFLSDGVPQDSKNKGCNLDNMTNEQEQACYLEESLDAVSVMRTAAISKAKDLRLYGIYYGASNADLKVLNQVSQEGGTSGVIQLTSFADNQSALCDLVISQASIEYRPDSVSALNLTTTRFQGELVADSDMDGVPDVEEYRLGWDPSNPRSLAISGVLDGICYRFPGEDGGEFNCRAKRADIICDTRKRVGIGMTECDFMMLGLNNLSGYSSIKSLLPNEPEKRLMAVDSDRDGMIDFVEIVKGTNPAEKDMNGDPDSDGVSNLNEIINGTDPFVADSHIPKQKLNDIQISYTKEIDPEGICQSGSWKVAVNRLQTTFVEQLPEIPDITDLTTSVLNHNQNEHMLILLHRMNPHNSVVPITEMYYSLVPFVFTIDPDGKEIVTPSEDYVSQKAYLQLGKVQP